MALGAIPATHSFFTVPGPGRDRQIATSAPANAAAVSPARFSRLVISVSAHLYGSALRSLRSRCSVPLLSQMMILPASAPAAMSRRAVQRFAAPAPTRTVLISLIFLPTIFRALSRPARVTSAVPCWSSCHTGMEHSRRSLSRTSKHFGLSISSRLIPPKVGCSILTRLTSSSASFASTQSGTASTPPKYLKRSAFPSITGRPASGPILPRPRTRVPSETMATKLPLLV